MALVGLSTLNLNVLLGHLLLLLLQVQVEGVHRFRLNRPREVICCTGVIESMLSCVGRSTLSERWEEL
jgi:hypothetical protein